jgi:uncharacterized protein (DUF58 family)
MQKLDTDKLDFSSIEEFGSIELLARAVVEGFIVGLHKSPFHGFSVEFLEHRQYNTGESTKHIDWKLFARTEKVFVKKFEEETNLRCQILVDTSSSMFYPDKGTNKHVFSVYAASALAYLLNRQRDAIGLTLFSDQIEKYYPSKSSVVQRKLIFSELENLLRYKPVNKKTATAKTLHQVAESIPKRSLVVILSDMLDSEENEDQVISALQHLKYNKHEVILFHVMDKASEMELDFEDRPYQFIDLESGDKIKLYPSEVREHYTKMVNEYRKKIMLKCGQFGIDYVEADINLGLRQVLLPFLKKRAKMP